MKNWKNISKVHRSLTVLSFVILSMINSVVSAEDNEQLSKVELEVRANRIREYYKDHLKEMEIVKTTRTKSGQIIDWIVPQSQSNDGVIAEPPPSYDSTGALIEYDPNALAPVVRFDVEQYLANVRTPAKDPRNLFKKRLPSKSHALAKGIITRAPESNDRYYAAWRQFNDSFLATFGYINIWDTEGPVGNENSIAQTAVMGGDPMHLETVEVGKIENLFFGDEKEPRLFVYFTTNGHQEGGDNIGGYNSLVNGWVPKPGSSIAAGMSLANWQSTTGGDQFDLQIRVELFQNNWWVMVNNEWIGHYPGTLFTTSGIRNSASRIDWYGEVYDDSAPAATSTDMGSGEFALAGYAKAAYFRNLMFQTSSGWFWMGSTGSSDTVITDSECYDMELINPPINDSWQNGFYYGGPGKEASGCN